MTNNLSTLRYDKISSSYPKVWTISQLPLQTAEDVNYLATTPVLYSTLVLITIGTLPVTGACSVPLTSPLVMRGCDNIIYQS